jgi:hypothetical protein
MRALLANVRVSLVPGTGSGSLGVSHLRLAMYERLYGHLIYIPLATRPPYLTPD